MHIQACVLETKEGSQFHQKWGMVSLSQNILVVSELGSYHYISIVAKRIFIYNSGTCNVNEYPFHEGTSTLVLLVKGTRFYLI